MVKIFGMSFGKKGSDGETGRKEPDILEKAPEAEQAESGIEVKAEAEAGPETGEINGGSEITGLKEAEDILVEAGREAEAREGQEAPAEEIPEQSPKKSPAARAAAFVLSEQDEKAPYTGEVELVFDRPVDPKMVAKLYNYLQATPEIKLSRTSGSWERGTTITVGLDKPISLISVLSSRIPEAQVAPERPGDEGFMAGKKGVSRIRLSLKK